MRARGPIEILEERDTWKARAEKAEADFATAAATYDELSSEYLQRAMAAEAERDRLRAALREMSEWVRFECGQGPVNSILALHEIDPEELGDD